MRQAPLRTRISPWAVLFAVIATWHAWRGAGFDTVIFALGTVLLTVESLRPDLLGTRHRVRVRGKHAAAVCTALGAGLVVAPRASALTVTLVTVIGVSAFFMAWYHLHQRYRPALTITQRTGIHLWLGVATFLLLVEFAAYMAASASGSDERFPTITVLIDPTIGHMWGRAVFVTLWLLGGWALVSVKPRANAS